MWVGDDDTALRPQVAFVLAITLAMLHHQGMGRTRRRPERRSSFSHARLLVAIFALAATACVFASGALAGVPLPRYPADGTTVKVTPPSGFANGTVPFRWSITYPDCPGPDDIHSSAVVSRHAGVGEFQAVGGGPFLGDGTFTNPAGSFFPQPPFDYEWKVFWACGATDNFAGAQGYSGVMHFTIVHSLATSTPAPKPRVCTSLTGKQRSNCLALKRRDTELRRCGSLPAVRRAACVAGARAAYRRAIG